MNSEVKVIVMTGKVGMGKTTLLCEASDLLSSAGFEHAAIDLDFLGFTYLEAGLSRALMFRDLEVAWSEYRGAGVTRLLLAETVVSRGDFNRIREATRKVEVIVCRFFASSEIAGTPNRALGALKKRFVGNLRGLERVHNDASLANFSIPIDYTSPQKASSELFMRSGWLRR
jgi:hypothetical protein